MYSYPNYSGVVKTFSLGFNLKDNYDPFAAVVGAMVPDRVAEGKLRMWNSPPAVVFFVGLLVYFVFLFIVFLVAGIKH